MKINYTKISGSGNDFIIVEGLILPATGLRLLARKVCSRKSGMGADGFLLVDKSKRADVRMRIFNADGSEAEMCGNGARCAAYYARRKNISIETKAGIIKAKASGRQVKIRLTEPSGLKPNIPVQVNGRTLRVNFINTGVPHTVIFVQGITGIDVFRLGRAIRNHKRFSPRGTNVNFVQAIGSGAIKVRTYERGVEAETLACGTGAVASALVFSAVTGERGSVRVLTKGGGILKVYFEKKGQRFNNVWLEGAVKVIRRGVYNV